VTTTTTTTTTTALAAASNDDGNIAAASNLTGGGVFTSATLIVIAIVAIVTVVVIVGVVAMLIAKKQFRSNMQLDTIPVHERVVNPSFEMTVLHQQKLGNEIPTAVSMDEANTNEKYLEDDDVYVNVKGVGNTSAVMCV